MDQNLIKDDISDVIVRRPPEIPDHRGGYDFDGCRGIAAGLVVGALIWIVLLMLIYIGGR